ncbi:MAG: hypothetical protein Q8W44_03055 [Candidatus Palauibacterales bacterium]|nr:hypothetical protein [Candidatus Palauibacterales bacterium]
MRASAVYAVSAWIAVQVAAATFPALPVPPWAHTLVVLLAIFGLPVVVAVAWAYEITPEGVQRTVEEEQPPELLHARGTPWVALVLVGVVTAASAGLGWAAWQTWLSPGMEAVAARTDSAPAAEEEPLPRTRVAVLPFEWGGAADSTTHVTEGLTFGLIEDLSRISELDVVSHRGVKPYRNTEVPLVQVARELGAGSLVTGRVQATGDSLLVDVQLVNGRSASSDWTGTIRANRDSLLALRDDLGAGAVRGLRLALGEQIQREEHREVTESDEAWDLYNRARGTMEDARELRLEGEKKVAAGLYRRADSLFAEAEERESGWEDPTIERGWLELDRSQLPGREFVATDTDRIMAGLGHADRILASDAGSAAALELRGALLNALSQHPAHSDSAASLRERAMEDLLGAVSSDLDRARAWAEIADLHRQEGRFGEARDAARRARRADAFLTNEAQYLAKAFEVALDGGQPAEALRLARRGRELFPENAWWDGARLLALSTAGAPRAAPDSVWEILHRYERLRGGEDPFARLQVAAVLARQGLHDSARAVLRRAKSGVPEGGRPLARYYEANVRLHLGERSSVFELLQEFLAAYPDRREYVARDVYWEPIREDPAFRSLVTGAGAASQ